ncbi:hypothetical protein ACIA5E_18005 [Nocardia asteroides]|uniref:hypothetical protein n=1 Tax=Nocardia asteroides TaxID=1824 RepID=UPI0037B44AC9
MSFDAIRCDAGSAQLPTSGRQPAPVTTSAHQRDDLVRLFVETEVIAVSQAAEFGVQTAARGGTDSAGREGDVVSAGSNQTGRFP